MPAFNMYVPMYCGYIFLHTGNTVMIAWPNIIVQATIRQRNHV